MPIPEKPPEYDGMPEWPDDLPACQARPFRRKPQTSGVRFEVERGPAKQRGGDDAAAWDYQHMIAGTGEQIDAFWAFWASMKGLRFAMVDPRRNLWAAFRFVIGREPEEGCDPPDFTVTFQLERVG